jgi:acid phosphatase class B
MLMALEYIAVSDRILDDYLINGMDQKMGVLKVMITCSYCSQEPMKLVSGDGDDDVTCDKQIGMRGVSKIFSQQDIGTFGATQESFCGCTQQ